MSENRTEMSLRHRIGKDDRQRLTSVEERTRKDFEEYMANVKKLQEEVLTRERRLREMEAREAVSATELQRTKEALRTAEAAAKEGEEAWTTRATKLAAEHEARVKDLTNEFLTGVEKHRDGETRLRAQLEAFERRVAAIGEENAQTEASLKSKLQRTKEKKRSLKTKSGQLADQIKDLLSIMSHKDDEIRRVKESLITGRLTALTHPVAARPTDVPPRPRREPIGAEQPPPAPFPQTGGQNLGQMIDSLEKLAMDILKDDDL